jgi:hypothetical protein
VGQARATIRDARASERSWRAGVRAGLHALLTLLDSEPQLARVCIVEALGAGEPALTSRAQALEEAAAALEHSAPRRRASSGSPLSAEALVGAAFAALHTRCLEQSAVDGKAEPRPFAALLGQLTALLVLPYLGPTAAGEELARPLPPPPATTTTRHIAGASGRGEGEAGASTGDGNSDGYGDDEEGEGGPSRLLQRLPTRLTYRTVRCLAHLAEHPGASNRQVARGAGIADEGQVSKLLARLARAGLLAKEPPRPGHPNAWRLTPSGEGVLIALGDRMSENSRPH